ncbi:MAG: hypothetical protein JWQ30_2270 [Sediminibacterium sp.]|nr:hypothetical protein [Sediminibacterium sp.]
MLQPASADAQPVQKNTKPFVHPGMMQNRQSLELMKQKVLSGEAIWQTAFNNLTKETPLDFVPEPRAHISVGAYGANSSGGREYGKSATMAYNYALVWSITGKKIYADKAIEILNAWSPVLWDFDDNNAKLNVGLSAPLYLNAAEILKYSNSGWKEKDIIQFKRMVLTVFYPTIKDFFTEANGNWDASIINTLLCIGVFTDNRAIFNAAAERYYRGPGNSGITKYIYPNGQIQETTRDWDHVQLGIGEFAKAAQVAWTQGLDLYGAANNRLALGFEYAAKFMTGGEIPVYGILSTRAKEKFRDIYESVYHHYREVKGIDMPFTAGVLEKTRSTSSVALLTSLSIAPRKISGSLQTILLPGNISPVTSVVGASSAPNIKPPAGSIMVMPGDSIQAVINANAGKTGWVVLAKGVHTITAPLRIPSGLTLAGQGKETILFLAAKLGGKTIENAVNTMHDVVIRDLLIEGATTTITNSDPNADRRNRSYMSAPSREGIVFSAEREEQMHTIRFENITVQNFTKNGVAVRGARNVTVINCDFSDNGASVVPGAGFHHNLLLTRSSACQVSNSRFDTSPWGNGIDISFCNDVIISKNEAARNKLSGIRCTETKNITVIENFVEGNDINGISFDALMDGSDTISVQHNFSGNNGYYGIYIEKTIGKKTGNNKTSENGKE